jgi:hypothetical protein
MTSLLGPCCNCGSEADVAHIVMLPRRGPVPGFGWGCAACGLPPDGAIAVLCDHCIGQKVAFVCEGYPHAGKRAPVACLSEDVFDHDMRLHEEAEGTMP